MVSKNKKETAEATSTTTLTTKGREICMSEKEKNIVPSTAEAEMSEEEKQKLLEQFDKESKTRKFGSPVLKKAPGICDHRYLISSGFRIRPLHAGKH